MSYFSQNWHYKGANSLQIVVPVMSALREITPETG